uniref:Uncharacterized protein isoform X4 n=1 Tax=Nicotiana tabacum TaxID=4097 RepID=A0A1S3ZGJ9_TOBAC|nr:PREDICTED: uncharacterized protein LOC107786595 isoform X4 [Nicotiana tabacum]
MTKRSSIISYYKFLTPRLTLPSCTLYQRECKLCLFFWLLDLEMLGVFSSSIVTPPDELVDAGSRTPSPKITAEALVNRFITSDSSAVSIQINGHVQLAYTHMDESASLPRINSVRYLSIGESLLTDMWPSPMMPICLKVLVANHLRRSLKGVSSLQQLEN